MARLRSAFRSPPILGLLFVLIVFVIYLRLVRPVELARDIEIQDTYAYLADGSAGLRVVDISNPGNLVETGSYDTPGSANGVFVDGNKAYVADGGNGLLILDITDRNSIHALGRYKSPGSAQDVAVHGSYAYLVDSKAGMQVIRIDDASNPVHPEGFQDFKVRNRLARIAFHGQQAYLADTRGNLYIVDVSDRKTPKQIAEYNARSAINNIDFTDGAAYLAAGKRGLIALDISNPEKPSEEGRLDTAGSAQGVAIAGSYAYVADGRNGLVVVDVTKNNSLIPVGVFSQPKDATDLSISGQYIFIADGVDGIRAVDATVKLKPDLLSPKNQPSNTVDVAYKSPYAFLASESQGVHVLDVSDPMNPRDAGFKDTLGQAIGVLVNGDYIYVADGDDGLRVYYLTVSQPDMVKLEEKSHLDTPGEARNLAVDGNLAYLADGKGGLQVIDLEDSANPRIIGAEDSIKNAFNVAVLGEYAYVADGGSGLRVVNVLDPTRPAVVATLDMPGEARSVAVTTHGDQEYALVADNGSGLRVVDVTNPRSPQEVGYNEGPSSADDVVIAGNFAYVTSREEGVWVFDISEPENPRATTTYDTPGQAQGMALSENRLFVADYDRGLQILNVSDPNKLSAIGSYEVPKLVGEVVVRDYAYVLEPRGLGVYDVAQPNNLLHIGSYDTPGRAKGLAVGDGYAYIGVENSLYIIDISDPRNPQKASEFGLARKITGIALRGDYAYVANEGGLRIINIKDPKNPAAVSSASITAGALGVALWDNYAFIPSGPGGLHILNIADPGQPVGTSIVHELNDSRAVIVLNGYAYIADGSHGIGVVDVTKPAAPVLLKQLPLPGAALDLAVAEGSHDDYLFVASDGGGVRFVYILNPANPLQVGYFEPPGGNLAIDVQAQPATKADPSHFYLYVAGADQGLQILNAAPYIEPVQVGIYNSPGLFSLSRTIRETPAAFRTLLQGNSAEFQPKYWHTLAVFLFDLVIFVGAAVLFLALVAQFVLPVEGVNERRVVVGRLIDYLLGRIGPGVYVEEGRVYVGPGLLQESLQKPIKTPAPGAVMADARSVVVLERRRRRYPFFLQMVLDAFSVASARLFSLTPGENSSGKPNVRVVGPGLTFTDFRGFPARRKHVELVRGEADLRPQLRIRPEVRGYTRDGIELKTNIWAAFMLGAQPDELLVTYQGNESPENLRVIQRKDAEDGSGGKIIEKMSDELDPDDQAEIHQVIQSHRIESRKTTGKKRTRPDKPFIFNRENVFKAVVSRAQDVQDDTYMEWTALPPHVAVEVFRNLLQDEVYEELYRPGDSVGFRISDFRSKFVKSVRNLGILAYRFVERKDGESLADGDSWNESLLNISPARELQNHKVLRSRGIKVSGTGFSGLEPVNPMVENTLVDYWRAGWEKEAIKIKSVHEFNAMRIRNKARAQAQLEMATLLRKAFKMASQSKEALAAHLFQTLEDAATDPATRLLLPGDTIAMLRTLRAWLLPGEENLPPWELPPSRQNIPPNIQPPTSEPPK